MTTIGGSVVLQAQRVPNREALVMGSRRWTWRELDRAVALAAGALESWGLSRGDRLAIVSANSAEFLIAYFAGLRLGAVVVPCNARLAPPEISHILVDSGAQVVLSGPAEHRAVEAAVSIGSVDPPVRVLGLADLAAEATGSPVLSDRATEDDDALIVYTSGTTGRPKGVLHSHRTAIWAALAQITSLGMRDGERYLHLPPLYHSGGVVYTNAMALLGGCNVLIPAFDPSVVLEAVESERITALLAVPTMLQLLLREPGARERDTSSWSIGVFGAAPMPAHVIDDLVSTFPTVRFFQQCGQTEAGPTGLYSTPEQVLQQPDSSGHQAQTFVEARVVDAGGSPVAADSVGELCFRGPAVMKGYWRDPEATAETIRDGWLHTGDLVHVRVDGSMKLVDRMKDLIITGGRNVYSAEVEQALVQHPDVADCAVVGQPDDTWGETVVAVVTPAPGATPTLLELRRHCAPLIADYKAPRVLRIADIPRNPAGKIQKHLLRTEQ